MAGTRAAQRGARRTFFMIMTRKGSLMPSVRSLAAGHVTYVVEMLVDMISSTDDWMSLSVMRLQWPLLTSSFQICSGLEPERWMGRRHTRASDVAQAGRQRAAALSAGECAPAQQRQQERGEARGLQGGSGTCCVGARRAPIE